VRPIRVFSDADPESTSPRIGGPGTRRVATESADWWPAYQVAYLDLGYRWLPKWIEARLASAPATPLRIWLIGYEDGSQGFLLAALLEEAIDRMRQRLDLPEHAPGESLERERRRLDALRIEIVATDLGLPLDRHDRVFHLAGFEPHALEGSPGATHASAPSHEVANLTISELGPVEARKARAEVVQLEEQVPDLQAISPQRLGRLADAGKVAILMERFFRPGVEVRYAGASPRFEYLLHNDRWRIEDSAGVLNPGATWSMAFSLADVTESTPPKEIDLVVVTNVLPWLVLYAEAFDEEVADAPVQRAWTRIQDSLRRGGRILIDPRSESVLDPSWADPPVEPGPGPASGDRILVTTAVGVQTASRPNMMGTPVSGSGPEAEPVFVRRRCVIERADMTAARNECDEAAASAGFGAAFIRPCHPNDAEPQSGLSCKPCSNEAAAPWLCFGVPD
jgi:hypothetical protein